MISHNIISRGFGALAALALLASCSSDPEREINSSISEKDGDKISVFDVEASVWGMGGVPDGNFELVLVPEGTDSVVSLPARLSGKGKKMRCDFTIAHPVVISDGAYRLYVFGRDGSRIGHTLEVLMREEKLDEILSVPTLYKPMGGSGTQQDPFIIAKQSDFMSLIVDLDNEKGVHGRGFHYRQTADLEVPPQSSMTVGRGYYSTPFGGHYDGGGYKLTGLNYTGALNPDRDQCIGLFSELMSGAVVENVCIEGLNINRAMLCGAIAGKSSGTVTLRNISAAGIISDGGDYIGGLVGCVNDSLIVEGYDMSMTLSGGQYIGGVAGRVSAGYTFTDGDELLIIPGYLYVKGMSTEKHHFRITGTLGCGGVAGSLEGQTYVEDISLDHSVQSADQDVTIITVTDDSYAGGLFGELKIYGDGILL